MIPARVGLLTYGPTVQIAVHLHEHLAKQLKAQGKPVPDAVTGNAIIDTGATVTTIDTRAATALALRQSGRVEAFGIGGKSTGFTVACCVDIKGLRVNIARAHCHDLAKYQKDLVALIGRDILQHMELHYDGPNGRVTLVLPLPREPRARTKKPTAKRKKRKRK